MKYEHDYDYSSELEDVADELKRQFQLARDGRFERVPADLQTSEAFAVLAEEFGEVARNIAERVENRVHSIDEFVGDQSNSDLYEELIQVAAVALSWAHGVAGRL